MIRSAWLLPGWICLVCCCWPAPLRGQPGRHKDPLSWDRNIGGYFARYCYQCHGEESPSGDVNLAVDVNPRLILENHEKWTNVLDMLRSGQMPPEGEKQPSDEFRQLMIDFLEETLGSFDCDSSDDPGPPVLRRLNRTEYNHAVFDLTGLDLDLADNFPPEPTSYGFDNIGDSLRLTPVLAEMYHSAARTIVEALLKTTAPPSPTAPGWYAEFCQQEGSREQARKVLVDFATEAFRGPVDDYYINRLLRLYDRSIKEQESHRQAIGHGMVAILISPRFLLRLEADRPKMEAAYPVTDYELAARLSFFLWSRPPDERLRSLAKSGLLHQPKILQEQVRRMLKDERSGALVDNFFFQWLDLRRLEKHQPDVAIFPEFDEELRRSMEQEVHLVLRDIVQQDLPLTNLLDADFTYVDQRLAKHYGLQGFAPRKHERVPMKDGRRGGILTSAAFLMLQSDPGRTNIPRRGNFIAGQILGDAPPPPPPDVPELMAVDDGVQRTLRETFELHRSSPDCRACHQKIDPLGFSLENYDAIGRWRERDAGMPIDASAEMASGQEFHGPQGLKSYLRRRQEDFLRTMAEKMLIYALGRGLQTTDQCVVDDILVAARRDDFRFSSCVSAIVTSVPFTHRRNPEY